MSARRDNRLGEHLTGNDDYDVRLNQQDCTDKDYVTVTFGLNEPEVDSSRQLYFFIAGTGMDCTSSSTTCEDYVPYTSKPTLEELLKDSWSSDDCTGDGTRKIWVARIEDPEAHTAGDYWSNPIMVRWDMDPPGVPTGIDADPGEGKVIVKWDAGENADGGVSGDQIIVLYTSANTLGSDSDAESPGSTSLDGGVSGADTGASAVRELVVGAAELTTDDTTCPAGGFSEGDVYNPNGNFDTKIIETISSGKATVSNLKNDITYKFGVVAADDYKNYSAVSKTVCETPQMTNDFFEEYVNSGGKGGKFCFIATATFGSYDHPVVRALRRFRDEFLEPMPGGKQLIDKYYQVGPGTAAVIEQSPALKEAMKGALTLFAGATIPLSLLGPFGTMALSALAVGMMVRRRRRRR